MGKMVFAKGRLLYVPTAMGHWQLAKVKIYCVMGAMGMALPVFSPKIPVETP